MIGPLRFALSVELLMLNQPNTESAQLLITNLIISVSLIHIYSFHHFQLERIVDLKYSSPPDNTEVIRGAIQATVKAAKEVS